LRSGQKGSLTGSKEPAQAKKPQPTGAQPKHAPQAGDSSDGEGAGAACELCGRTFPHEHIRAMYRGGGEGEGDDDDDEDGGSDGGLG
jgi:hypothetical protein